MADNSPPYDPYIPSGQSQPQEGSSGNARTHALQAVRSLCLPFRDMLGGGSACGRCSKTIKNQGAMRPLLPTRPRCWAAVCPLRAWCVLTAALRPQLKKTHSESPEEYTAVLIAAAWRIPDGDWHKLCKRHIAPWMIGHRFEAKVARDTPGCIENFYGYQYINMTIANENGSISKLTRLSIPCATTSPRSPSAASA